MSEPAVPSGKQTFEEAATDTLRVFVYGSLKRGQHNHRFLATARFLGSARTARQFRLWATPHFPALVRDESDPVEVWGEVYEVVPATLSQLDLLEENGQLYQRELLPVWRIDLSGETWMAWVFLWRLPTAGLLPLRSNSWPEPVA